MRIVFLGTPAAAVPSLERLVGAGFDVAAVVTQPDRPKDRGRRLTPPPVKQAAERLGLPVYQPEKIRRPEVVAWFRDRHAEAMAVVAYGKILPQSILDIPPLGLVNVHFSLLPRYRGAAPVQWAIARGETRTGVTTMLIDAGLDTGDILLARETPIGPEENAVELSERLARMGAELLVETLEGLQRGAIRPQPQDPARATLAPMLTREDGRIDWRRPAREIHNQVRGLQPWPGAYTRFRGRRLHVWKSAAGETKLAGEPGELHVAGGRLSVVCGESTALELLEVQLEGRQRIPARAFLNGHQPAPGERLGESPE